jgi:hypothetical protein
MRKRMAGSEARGRSRASWSIDDVPYHALERARVKDNEFFFHIVASAAFVELTSDVYTRNLCEFFRGEADVVDWLEHDWETDELQHGETLKRYVQTAWPDFNWDSAYGSFLSEFQGFCSVGRLAKTPALEMAARCVVETGTATFYRGLADASPEPVLRTIAAAISTDEVRHYKHFYRFFLRYREREHLSRIAVARTLWTRMDEIDTEDAFYAFKHVYLASNPCAEFHQNVYSAFRAQVRPLVVRHFPHRMASKMLLKPLGLSAPVGRLMVPAVASASRILFLT